MEVKVLEIYSPSRITVRPRDWDKDYHELKKSFNDFHNFEVNPEALHSFDAKSLGKGDVVR